MSANPSPVTAPAPHDEVPVTALSPSRRGRVRVPLWFKAATAAAVLALVALLLSSPGTAAVVAGCVLAGAAMAAIPLALPRRASDAMAEGTINGLRTSAAHGAGRLGRTLRRTRRTVRRNARAAQRELGERGEAVPAVALVVVSVVLWGAIVVAILSR